MSAAPAVGCNADAAGGVGSSSNPGAIAANWEEYCESKPDTDESDNDDDEDDEAPAEG